MNYTEALSFIISKQRLGIKPGLSRIEKLLEKMGNPQNNLRIVHIAGTNGKGSVANSISDALVRSGMKAGLFTSPWITDYREQIQINNRFISERTLAKYVSLFGDCDATEFELLTAIMYKYFDDEHVDYAVVECGMGGDEDSTNAVEKTAVSVITSVSLDHVSFLGDTIEKIAAHKAGIIKKNGTCVLYPNPLCSKVFEKRCKEMNARLVKVPDAGNFQNNNILTANAVLKEIGIDASAEISHIPARQEMINGIMLDGAHNTDGAYALKTRLPDNGISAVIGMMEDKDIDGYMSVIAPLCDRIITVRPSHPRAASSERLAAAAKKYCKNVLAEESISRALAVLNARKGFKLVCGSFYLARDIRKMMLELS